MSSYVVSHNGEQLGPWSADEILKMLKTQKLSWTDYLFDEQKSDWVLLMDHEKFSSHFLAMTAKPSAPKGPPKKEGLSTEVKESGKSVAPNLSSGVPTGDSKPFEKEWFILKSENRYGPFSFPEVVRMLQEKNIFEYDYIWNQAMSTWKRIAEVEEFRPDRIRALKDSGTAEVQEVFFRRRHARVAYGASILVHNNKKVWKGQSIELSSGGAGLVIDNLDFAPGQTLFLHFKPGDGVPPFNAICTIVSKQVAAPGSSSVRYGVKFTSINRNVQEAIREYTDQNAA